MTTTNLPLDLTHYPEADGKPMTESDATRDYLCDYLHDYLIYCVEALELYFQSRRSIYVSGNLFIDYEQGNPQSDTLPDMFAILSRKLSSYRPRNSLMPS